MFPEAGLRDKLTFVPLPGFDDSEAVVTGWGMPPHPISAMTDNSNGR